jgi:polyisoprenoid-binding protein YceI
MARWMADTAHSEIQFKVKHLMISTVTGRFTDYDVKVVAEGEDFQGAQVSFTARVESIDTKNEMRDAHLRSEDFFAAEKYPEMTFRSSAMERVDDHTYLLKGDLTIRGTTLPVTLNADHTGSMVDPYGNVKAGFDLEGTISRSAFGLLWNGMTEAGGVVVSDAVKLHMHVQLQKAVAVETEIEEDSLA